MVYMGVSTWDFEEPGPEERAKAKEAVVRAAGDDAPMLLEMLGLDVDVLPTAKAGGFPPRPAPSPRKEQGVLRRQQRQG